MNARKFFLIATLLVLAIAAVACAAPTPTPMPIPTPIPPTAVPAAKPTDMPKPTEAPKPTTAPTMAPMAALTTAPMAVAFDLKAAFDKYFAALPDGFGLIAPAAASDQMKATKVFLLDMREVSEITTNGFIEGAVNIPTRTLMKNLDKLPAKDQPIIVMCGSGVRSPLGMAALQLLGYTNVKNLTGGFNGWKAANLPVATGAPATPMAGMAPTVDKDLLAALDKWFTALPDGWNGIAPAAAKDQMAATKVTLIDVREASEITANGKIEGSISIPVRTLIKNLDKLPADKAAPIIVTCASGHRGMFSMMALQMLGYTNVKNISGGLNAWKTANLSVVQ